MKAQIKRLAVQTILLILAGSAVGYGLSRAVSWAGCQWYGHETGREVRYSAFIGCLVKVDDRQWVPRSELRMIQQ